MHPAVPCECCGRPVFTLELEEIIVACGLTTPQAQILRILARRRGNWMTSLQVASALYADDPNGGPDNARGNINVHVFKIRKKLQVTQSRLKLDGKYSVGFRLVAWPKAMNTGRDGGYLRLEALPA